MNNSQKSIFVTCIIPNIKGLHARAAARIVSLSSQFDCNMTVSHKNKSASSLSLIKLLTLDAPKGSEITISATGKQKELAIKNIQELILNGFGE